MKPYPSSTSCRRLLIVSLILAVGLAGLRAIPGGHATASPAPARLSDQEFWKLSTEFSEEDGFFRSDNLLSNELNFQSVIPELLNTAKPGRVYLGVGPEQNFSYIAALKPAMVFIVDIRHGNLDVHLMYKALFELSKDRAEFVSRLFSRKQPDGLGPESTARQIFSAYLTAVPDPDLFDATLEAIETQLKTKHGFALSAGDLDGIEWALLNFYRFGPSITYNSSSRTPAPAIVGAADGFGRGGAAGGFGRGGGGGGGGAVSYAQLMMADDGFALYLPGELPSRRQTRSYLATEESFAFLKELESRNLLVPVVGDFGGPKAIRAVGKYLKSIDAMVSAFYLSNVEQYLSQDGKTRAFLANVGTLPLDDSSAFIRSGGRAGRGGGRGGVLGSELGNILDEVTPYLAR